MLELKIVDLILFLLFYFLFILFFYFELRVGVSMISHVTVTECHKSVTSHRRTKKVPEW